MLKFQAAKGKQLIRSIWLIFIILFATTILVYSQQIPDKTDNPIQSKTDVLINEPFTVVLLIENSEKTLTQNRQIQEAAIAFVKALKSQHKVSVFTFGDGKTYRMSKPTNDKQKLYKAIRRGQSTVSWTAYNPTGWLYDAVDYVLRKTFRKIKGRKAILLFTNGVDTGLGRDRNNRPIKGFSRNSYEKTVIQAKESNALIFPIYYEAYSDYSGIQMPTEVSGNASNQSQIFTRKEGIPSGEYDLGRKYLEDLAANTLGQVVYPESTPEGMKKIVDIAEVLHRLSMIPIIRTSQPLKNKDTKSESDSGCSSTAYKKNSNKLKIGGVERKQSPIYSDALKKAGIGGEVRVLVTIDESGNVIEAKAFSGHPLLRTPSEEAANKLKFKRTLLCGKPIKFTQFVIFRFSVSDYLVGEGARRKHANSFLIKAFGSFGKGTAKDIQTSLTDFEKAQELYRNLNDSFTEAIILEYIGTVYYNLGERKKSLESYEQALALYKTVGVKLEQATILNKIGLINSGLGNYSEALASYDQSLPIVKDLQQEGLEARTIRNIGDVYSSFGEKEKALDYYDQAISIQKNRIKTYPFYTNAEDRLEEAITYNHIGSVFAELGNSQKALEYFHQALPIHIIFGDKRGEAGLLNNIGLAYSNLGETNKALRYYFQALPISRLIKYETAEAAASSNIGTIYLDLGEKQKALEYYNQSLQINRALGDKRNEARGLNNLGLVYMALRKEEQALDFFHQTLPIQKAVGDKGGEANTLRNLMWSWKLSANHRLAILYGKQSVNKYQELRQAIQGLDKEIQKDYLLKVKPTYRALADLLISEGRFAQAEQVLRMLKEEEFFDFVRRDADEIKNLNQRVYLNAKEQELILEYSQLADRISQIGQEFQKIENKKRELSRENLELSAEEQKRFEELSAQVEIANAAFKLFLEKTLIEELGKETAKEIEYDRNLQAKLRKWGNGTVALYTVAGEDRYRVILTTPTVQVDGKHEIPIADLNKKIFAFRDALQNPKVDPRPLGKELYDILIKPIEKELEAAEAKTLVWSLDGTLRYIPLAALSPDGESYLVEKYQNVIITPKTKDDISDSNSEWQALGLGISEQQSVAMPDNPSERITFNPLPAAREELTAIVRDEQFENEQGILAGRRFIDSEFTAKNFTDSLLKERADGKKKFTVVHIASHFRLGINWSNSFLLLGNGQILTLEQISNSPNISFGDVDLITLSACNTAFADESNGKEVDSLAEAIQERGGKAVLATLWAVADESTAQLMSEFYRLKKENPKLTKAEAIQKAQMAMIAGKLKSNEASEKRDVGVLKIGNESGLPKFETDQDAPFAHPYYWSPFVLIGNWR